MDAIVLYQVVSCKRVPFKWDVYATCLMLYACMESASVRLEPPPGSEPYNAINWWLFGFILNGTVSMRFKEGYMVSFSLDLQCYHS